MANVKGNTDNLNKILKSIKKDCKLRVGILGSAAKAQHKDSREILNGVFEHLAIVKNPRYEGAFIAVNRHENSGNEYPLSNPYGAKAYIASNAICKNEFKENDHPRDEEGKFTDGNNEANPNYKEELKQIIEKAKENPNERQKLVIGKVSKQLEEKAKADGFNISGYSHDLDVSGTRHAIKGHSNPKAEESRGQIAITDEDFERIPDIIYDYDDVSFGEKDNKGTPLVKYEKTFADGTTIYVEEIRTRQNTLTIKTMYKTKKASNSRTFTDFNPQRKEYTSTIIIAYDESDFNPNITKYDKAVNFIRNYRKDVTMDTETKNVFSMLIDALKARNEAEEKKDKDCDDNAANKAKNADEDKRKLIDEVAGIMKSAGADDELIRTAIAKMEKIAYDKSEAGTADNKAAKNEDEDKTEKKDDKKAENEDEDNEDDKTDKEAANKAENEEEKKLYEEL